RPDDGLHLASEPGGLPGAGAFLPGAGLRSALRRRRYSLERLGPPAPQIHLRRRGRHRRRPHGGKYCGRGEDFEVTDLLAGPGADAYRFVLLDVAHLVSTLASDTLHSIANFKVTLNAVGDLYFDNLSAGTLQPANSLSFSYDVYNGQIDQAYIRAGAMAWVAY